MGGCDRFVAVAVADEYQVLQIRALGEHVPESGRPLRGRYQYAHIAVAHDVSDLSGLEQWVDRHKHTARARCSEHAHDVLDLFGQIDGDSLQLADTEREQRRGECLELGRKRPVIDFERLVLQRVRLWSALGSPQWQFKKQIAHGGFREIGSRRRVWARVYNILAGTPVPSARQRDELQASAVAFRDAGHTVAPRTAVARRRTSLQIVRSSRYTVPR